MRAIGRIAFRLTFSHPLLPSAEGVRRSTCPVGVKPVNQSGVVVWTTHDAWAGQPHPHDVSAPPQFNICSKFSISVMIKRIRIIGFSYILNLIIHNSLIQMLLLSEKQYPILSCIDGIHEIFIKVDVP